MSADNFLKLVKKNTVELVGEDSLVDKLKRGKVLRVKLGVDPTSCDLHLGHSVVLEKLRLFQDFGHIAVLIIGDFTAQIGDPSGRDSERPVLDRTTIEKNARTYTEQAFKILNRERTEIKYNSEWLADFIGKGEFFRVAKNITLSRLIERDDFSERISAGLAISLLELLYPVFQGFDSVAVKADVEIGGSDQLFNLLVGRDIQKIYSLPSQTVITMPLLPGTDGVKKMSKTSGNYIALNDSPKDIFGKIMSISDDLMLEYYRLFTDKDIKTIQRKHPMDAKKDIAFSITAKYCGRQEANLAQRHFEKVFSRKQLPDEMSEFNLERAMNLSALLFESGMTKSKNEARRLILQGAVKMNEKKVKDDVLVEPGDFVLRVGRRHFKKIKGRKR